MKYVIRPSEALTYDNCGFQHYLRYVLRVKSRIVAANLPFGTSVHEAVTGYIAASVMGDTAFDPEAVFLEKWAMAMESTPLDFPSTWSPSAYTDTGKRLVNSFPAYWDKTGYIPLVDRNGPLVERRMQVRLAPNLVLSGQPDVVAMDQEGEIGPLDIKTTISPFQEQFIGASEQLLDYEILLEANGFAPTNEMPGVSFSGFIEGLKRKASSKTDAAFLPPAITGAKTAQRKDERIQKLCWIAEDIARKRFPKRPRQAHNTPCSMCEYWDYCHNGKTRGLIFPQNDRSKIIQLETANA